MSTQDHSATSRSRPVSGPSRRALLAGTVAASAATTIPLATPAVATNVTKQPAGGKSAALRFTAPTPGAHLTGLTDIALDAPDGTSAVRLSLDDTWFSELTDLYSEGTGLDPVWRTATDASWFPEGRHRLHAEADTPTGTVRTSIAVSTARPSPEPSRTVLDGAWRFATAAELPDKALEGTHPPATRPDFADSGLPTVVVPSAYGAVRDRFNDDKGAVVLYRRSVTVPRAKGNTRTLLTLDSCYFSCRVFVNGESVGEAKGGYLPERFDVTESLRSGENTLAIIVDNRMDSIFPLNPELYWNWGGIFASVHLDRVAPVALTGITADGAADGTLVLRVSGSNTSGTEATVHASVTVDGPTGHTNHTHGKLDEDIAFTLPAGSGTVDAEPVTLHLDDVQLWEAKPHPALYTVTVRPHAGQAPPLHTRAGFRDVQIRDGDLRLNGHPLRELPGFNRHADYPGLGRAQPHGLAYRELRALRDRGYRIFRPAHYPTTPAELDAADALGLLVIEEINVTQVYDADKLTSDRVTTFAKQRLSKMVRRDRGHPALIAYSVGNENGTESAKGAGYVRELAEYARELDRRRPVTHVTGWGAKDQAFAHDDFVCVNIYDGWYYDSFATLTDPDGGDHSLITLQKKIGKKPFLLSEYGAEAVSTISGLGKGTEYYQGLLIDEYNRRLHGFAHLTALMYWTSTEFMLTPEGGTSNPSKAVPGFHNKGLQTYWREPKLGYRVMFAPVRIDTIPKVTAGDEHTVVTVTIREIRGQKADGALRIAPPEGMTVRSAERRVHIAAHGTVKRTIRLSGKPAKDGAPGMVHAVFPSSDTEAQPRPLHVHT